MTLDLIPILTAWPCDKCDITPDSRDSGRCPCVLLNTAEDIAALAYTTTAAIACISHIELRSRVNLAAGICDAIANALEGVNAELDVDAFMRACGARYWETNP